VLTWTTEAMLEHMNKLLRVPGVVCVWGGRGHRVCQAVGGWARFVRHGGEQGWCKRCRGWVILACRHKNWTATSYSCVLFCCPAVLLPFSHSGAQLLWGGKPLEGHSIPKCYGAIQPTAVFVPLASMQDPSVFKLVTTEVFGPFQVVSEFEGEGWCALAACLVCCLCKPIHNNPCYCSAYVAAAAVPSPPHPSR
jgi:hypothetical protein